MLLAALRTRRSAFHYFQLLSEEAAAGNGWGARSVCENPGGSSPPARVPAGWVRGDAGACTFVAQRAGQEKPVEDFTSAEAEGGAGAVEEAKTTE